MNVIVRNSLGLWSLKNMIVGLVKVTGSTRLGVQMTSRALWSKSQPTSLLTASSVKTLDASCVSCRFFFNEVKYAVTSHQEIGTPCQQIIQEEKDKKAVKTIPTEFEGFEVSSVGNKVFLAKTDGNETIKFSFDVRDSYPRRDLMTTFFGSDNWCFEPEKYVIEIEKGGRFLFIWCETHIMAEVPTLATISRKLARKNVHCYHVSRRRGPCNPLCASGRHVPTGKLYIEKIAIVEGECVKHAQEFDGETLSKTNRVLYDLLLKYLDEKGLNYEFIEKLIELNTSAEYALVFGTLEGLSKFKSK